MRDLVWRTGLLAALLFVSIEREVMAVREACRTFDISWFEFVTTAQVFPGQLLARMDMMRPTSSPTLVGVAISAVAWSVLLHAAWQAIRRLRAARGAEQRGATVRQRPLTWILVAIVGVVGAWDVRLRASDLQTFEYCQSVTGTIPVGARRDDVRAAILEARPDLREVEGEQLVDRDQNPIETACHETYGDRIVFYDIRMADDEVVQVDTTTASRSSCDVITTHLP